MSKVEHKRKKEEISIQWEFQAIEILNCVVTATGSPLNNFNFEINIESRFDPTKKLVFVIVTVNIKGESPEIAGSMSVSFIYHIINYEEVVKANEDFTKYTISGPVEEILNSISISTMRGVMFTTFKGTFLHNAILPIVDPKAFKRMIKGNET